MKIQIINGPNINLLGKREPGIYGSQSFDDYLVMLKKRYPEVEIAYYQSNCEGNLIDKLQEVGFDVDGIILNAGAYTHTSIALQDAIRAIKLINEAEPQLMDYGLINLHPFFCTCGVGLDAFISQKFAEAGKRGFLTYVENILQNALSYNPETYEIELVDEESEKQVYEALLITCANASQWGNNAFIAPQASVRDGLMDVTIIEPFTLLEVPQLALQLMNGTIDKSGRIKSFRCKNLLIKRSKPGAIHYDGDPVETGENIEVSLIRNGLSCMCPTDEGVMDMSETIQNQLVEHFNEMYLRSQEIQENIQNQNRRIMQLNKDIVNRLSRIGRRRKDEE